MSDPHAHVAISTHDTLTSDLRRIRIGLPMDAALFGEVMTLITDRWPGTTVTGDGHHFTLQLPPEPESTIGAEVVARLDEELKLMRQAGPVTLNQGVSFTPDLRIIHDGQLYLLAKDERNLWATDRGYRLRWDPTRDMWHLWNTSAPEHDPEGTGLHRWITTKGLEKWIVPNQYPLRRVDR